MFYHRCQIIITLSSKWATNEISDHNLITYAIEQGMSLFICFYTLKGNMWEA